MNPRDQISVDVVDGNGATLGHLTGVPANGDTIKLLSTGPGCADDQCGVVTCQVTGRTWFERVHTADNGAVKRSYFVVVTVTVITDTRGSADAIRQKAFGG